MKHVKLYEEFQLAESSDLFRHLINKSQSHSIYQDPAHRDRVIKTGKNVLEHAKAFKENPELCPTVYEVHEEADPPYIVIEKLETEKAASDFDRLINRDRGYVHNWGHSTFKNSKSFQAVRDSLTTEEGRSMLDRVREIVLATGMKDIHSRNFGYDKKGRLKALDL